ncbi:MAG: fimbria major subunit [Muribaculaceae bacterium]|nr:fimbria major subunit [Muribaculaceae bacterium]
MSLQSCVADTLTPDIPSPDAPTVHAPNRFAAFRLVINDDTSTRAVYDSDYDDYNTHFNKGLPFESALYFPENASPEEDLIVADDEDPDLVVPKFPDLYHFAILADENEEVEKALFPIILDSTPDKENNENWYTAYTYFYSTDDGDNPYNEFKDKTIYVVLNASPSLSNAISDLFEKAEDPVTIDQITKIQLKNTALNGDFLFLKDKKGNFITSDKVHPYFTMSSSLIVDDNKNIIPAQVGNFTLYNTKKEAEDNPTTLYVERLQAKYTVLFKGYENYQVSGQKTLNEGSTGNGSKQYYFYTEPPKEDGDQSAPSTGTSSPFVPVQRLIVWPQPQDGQTEIKEIKYVDSYHEASPDINNRIPVDVKSTTNWKVNIIGWDINGIEQDQYLFKNYDKTDNHYWGQTWFFDNTKNYYFTFWAEDPHYKKTEYPHQYRSARQLSNDPSGGYFTINENIPHWEKDPNFPDEDNSTLSDDDKILNYKSFNDLSVKEPRRYVPEHTFSLTSLGSNPYDTNAQLRVGSHLVITAQLLIDGFEFNNVFNSGRFDNAGLIINQSGNAVRTKYLMNDIYWDEVSYITYAMEYLGYWMLADENKDIFKSGDGKFYTNTRGAKAEWGDFIIDEAHMDGGDALVWVKPAVDLYAFDPNGDDPDTPEDERYTPIELDKFRKLAYEHQNYMAQRLMDGRMYYATGSRHRTDAESTLSPAKVGDFGTVRNNWYYFTIDKITAPGTPVSVETQPIIPNHEPAQTGLGVSLKILDWHQEVIDVDVADQNRPK